MLPQRWFSDYKYTIWIDGTIELKASPKELVEKCRQLVVYKHLYRDCAYIEGETCAEWGHDKKSVIDKQLERYRAEKYPKKNGLASTRVLVRKNTKKVNKFNEMWLQETTAYSFRDQISFNYCVWKSKIKVDYFKGNSLDGILVNSFNHLK